MSTRYRQLCETFPYLAVDVLFTQTIDDNARDYARQLVERGAPLKDIADVCGISMALRKIPPGATRGVDRVHSVLAENPQLVHAYLPSTLPAIRRWLLAIECAQQIGGPFTEWVARHATEMGRRLIEVHSLISDLRDWVSATYTASVPEHVRRALVGNAFPDDRLCGEYVTRQFDPGMSLATVIQLSEEWHEAVANGDHQSGYDFPEPWCPAGSVNGYEIVPITNGADLYREGKTMHHCVGTYSANVAQGSIYIYSLREAGERIATFELVRDDNRVRLGQVRGPCNKNVDKKIVTGVRRWLGQQKSFTFPAPPEPRPAMVGDPGYGYAANNLDDEIPF